MYVQIYNRNIIIPKIQYKILSHRYEQYNHHRRVKSEHRSHQRHRKRSSVAQFYLINKSSKIKKNTIYILSKKLSNQLP